MRLYTAHHRPNPGDVDPDVDPDVVFIKEGFCWPALFVPLLWLLYRRQLWGLLAYLGLSGILSALTWGVGMDNITALALSVVLSLAVAAQANDWRRWRLGARGYQLAAVVAAGSLQQAEAIFFNTRWQHGEAAPSTPARPIAPLPASGLTPFATPFDPV
ncbi:MAG: DUF2628 domain-containing protein [Alphaproteobacteria bacterium]|jgi:hypothetical protein|nr:DUF2628 domain-containing protein [Alphaproteobacteria bacterium]|tara:strand:- start:72 stop:548 length:477 start_codon:yes stop_codon:yes gene_type:complete